VVIVKRIIVLWIEVRATILGIAIPKIMTASVISYFNFAIGTIPLVPTAWLHISLLISIWPDTVRLL
jgi:hypothetical protein